MKMSAREFAEELLGMVRRWPDLRDCIETMTEAIEARDKERQYSAASLRPARDIAAECADDVYGAKRGLIEVVTAAITARDAELIEQVARWLELDYLGGGEKTAARKLRDGSWLADLALASRTQNDGGTT